MGYIIWLAFATAMGAAGGQCFPTTPHPWAGAALGFCIGLAIAFGGGDDVADAIGDFDWSD